MTTGTPPPRKLKPWLLGALTTPLGVLLLIALFPVPFVRLAGCTGDLEGVAVSGGQVIVGERVSMNQKRGYAFRVMKVSVLDASSGKPVAGPWVHHEHGWVGLWGDLYCVSGWGLECASVKDGRVALSRSLLEQQEPRLAGHWPRNPSSYRVDRNEDLVFKATDGVKWRVTRDLAVSDVTGAEPRTPRSRAPEPPATEPSDPEPSDTEAQAAAPPAAGPSAAHDAVQVTLVGEARKHFQVLPAGAPSAQTWLAPKFLVDGATGRRVRSAAGWVITSSERRVDGRVEGLSISSVNELGVETWKAPVGDDLWLSGSWVVGDLLLVRTSGSRHLLEALDLATGQQRWRRSFDLW